MSTRVQDWRGNVYTEGDMVLYPRMVGRTVEMQEGIVEEIIPFPDERLALISEAERVDAQKYRRELFTNHKVKIKPTRSSRYVADRWTDRSVWIQIGENVTATT